MSELWAWTATHIAARVAGGVVSARDVAVATRPRIADVEPRINALSEVTEDIALQTVDAMDSAQARGEHLGTRAGVPGEAKNNVSLADPHNTGGVVASKDIVCEEDSPPVAGLNAAGAVIVGRTNLPAFPFRWCTDTDLNGRTCNPHGRHLSPGGTSGGVGSALARTVGDLASGLNAMAVPDPRDSQKAPVPRVAPAPLPRRSGLVRASELGKPAPKVDAALTRAAEAVEAVGCTVEEGTLPQFADAYRIWQRLVFLAIQSSGDRALVRNSGRVVGKTEAVTAGKIADTWSDRLPIMREWSMLFLRTRVVVMPVSYGHALQIDGDPGDGATLGHLFHDQSPLLATAVLRHSGLAVPTGLANDGAPTGVQLVARWWNEGTLPVAGQAIEDAGLITPVSPE